MEEDPASNRTVVVVGDLVPDRVLQPQARDLVLVLDREQLEAVAGGFFAYFGVAGETRFLGLPDLVDEPQVALGDPRALVEEHVGDPTGQETIELASPGGALDHAGECRPELRRPTLDPSLGGFLGRGGGLCREALETGGGSEPLRIRDGEPAVAEGLDVVLDRHAVCPQRFLDEAGLERQQALLVGGADQEDVARDAVAKQPFRGGLRVDEVAPVAVGEQGESFAQFVERRHASGAVGDHGRRADAGGVRDDGRRLRRKPLDVVRGDRGEQVERQRQVGLAFAELVRPVDRLAAEQEVRNHRAALLGEAGLVEMDRVPPFEQRRGDQDRVDGHDAGAADAHEQSSEGGVVGQLTDGFRRFVFT